MATGPRGQLTHQLRQVAGPAARHSATSQDSIYHKCPHGDEGRVLAQHLCRQCLYDEGSAGAAERLWGLSGFEQQECSGLPLGRAQGRHHWQGSVCRPELLPQAYCRGRAYRQAVVERGACEWVINCHLHKCDLAHDRQVSFTISGNRHCRFRSPDICI